MAFARRNVWLASLMALAIGACASNPAPAADVRPEPVAPLADEERPAAPAPVPAPLASPAPAAPAPAPAEAAASKARDGELDAYLDGLRAISCPEGTRRSAPEHIEMTAKRVPLQALNPARRTIGALTFMGGFELDSSDARLGGLSGLDVMDDGGLLAVSDAGDFVWIALAEDGVTPAGARIAPMLDAQGAALKGKRDADAEGLAVRDGLALVSFERDHRVLAYDVGVCGGAARGAPIVVDGFGRSLPASFAAANLNVSDNEGPEPLGVTDDWFLFTGVEASQGGAGPLSARPIEAAPAFDLRIAPGAPAFVGLDLLPAGTDGKDVRAFSLHRGQDRLLGSPIVIHETYLERRSNGGPAVYRGEIDERSHETFRIHSQRTLAELSILQTIDNYEGIAARQMSDGRVRLYIVSDDNFSTSQRTLLMVFDLLK